MLPSVPIFPVYNFFRQNIWHSIFDQFHFHHIFGDKMTVSLDKTGKGTSRPVLIFCRKANVRNILGTSWMAIRDRGFKDLDAQQASQQMSYFYTITWYILHIFTELNFQICNYAQKHFCPYLQDFWQISDADIFHWIFGWSTTS